MALFNLGSVGDISLVDDIDKVQSYLYKLNEQLKYMFANLTPEDNYSKEAYDHYLADGKTATLIEQTVKGIKLEMLTSDNVVSAINLSKEGVQIRGDKISLEGAVTVNGYFKVGLDGSIEAKNGRFSGDISGSTISGSEIRVGGAGNTGAFVVYDQLDQNIGQWDANGIAVFKGDISIGFVTITEDTAIFGPFSVSSYDSETGRYVVMSENEDIGFTTRCDDPAQLWIWAGYDQGTDSYKFQVNNSGQVWADDFCLRGGYGSIRDTIDAIYDEFSDVWDAIRNP